MLDTAPNRPSPEPPGPHRRPRRPSRLVIVATVLALLLVPVEFSYGRALAAPGSAPVSVRTVEWLRDHGAGPVVDLVEYWVYSRNRPTGAAPDPASLPRVASSAGATGVLPTPLPVTASGALPGEAQWVPSAQVVGADHPLYTGYFRPDPTAPSVIAGVAWMNRSLISSHLIAGTIEPVPPGTAAPADEAGGQVPTSLRPDLLATFNSGFRLKDARGGYAVNGREIRPLVDGAASLVIDTSGRITIGQWGRDVRSGPDVAAVRQNLALVVDGGAPVPGLDANRTSAWGTSRNQLQYTWRSGLGLDAGGNLVYVAADQISLSGLAQAMTAAGIVRGMQLDIHSQTVGFLKYRPGQAASSGRGSRLLPGMHAGPVRYLEPDQRDFLAVTAAGTTSSP
ncbi:hypothetical protein [Actinomycetospora sp. CA-053990]|uniref:hypothetical protein n=1 Tax=Actinomycetospora sp. CA-053990 TaxID=3239891 RepID=UPI003D8B345F